LQDPVIRQVFQDLGLRRHQPRRRIRRGTGQLPVLDLAGRRRLGLALTFLAAAEEGVGEDAVQPGLQVRAGLELPERGVRPGERSWTGSSASAGLRVMRSAVRYIKPVYRSAFCSKRAARCLRVSGSGSALWGTQSGMV
jgi:hypothetical protein